MARRELSPACLRVVQAVTAQPVAGPVLIACSGGADSLALTAAAAHLQARGQHFTTGLKALVVDHGLQPGSAEVAARVVERLAALGLPADQVAVEVTETGAGLEADARVARYSALVAAAQPNGQVWLGHTLDDQAETVLLGLARGSGTRSLAGMAPTTTFAGVTFARPLLGLRRTDTAQACADWGLDVWDDPMNADTRFARVRVRQRVLPLLEAELGPGIAQALARTGELARADADELDAQAAALAPEPGADLEVGLLAALPPALASRVLRGWLLGNGITEPGHGHIAQVLGLVTDWHGQAGVDLPGGYRVRRTAGQLRVGPLGLSRGRR